MKNIRIRNAEKKDVPKIASMHTIKFKGDFLSAMGRNFLELIYYTMLEEKSCKVIVMTNDHDIVGFISGSLDLSILFRYAVKTRFFNLCRVSALAVLRNPLLIPKIFQTIFYADNSEGPELVSIAVKRKFRKKGIGKKLTRRLIKWFKKNDVKRIRVIVNVGNHGAREFYKKVGFQFKESFKLYGKRMITYSRVVQKTGDK